jgi:phospholipid transport system substrate-binding protein
MNYLTQFTFLIQSTLLLFVISFSSSLAAEKQINTQFHNVESNYKNKIGTINQQLNLKQNIFNQSKQELAKFVDESLLPTWSSTKTLKGLFGKAIWLRLSNDEQQQLVKAFNDTLQRYVQESFEEYDGQQFLFERIKLNKHQNKGYLTIKLIPNLLPSFNIDLKIALIDNQWLIYDAMVQGVSYISLKKDSFRELYKNKSIDGVLAFIKEKNMNFIPSKMVVSSFERLAASK